MIRNTSRNIVYKFEFRCYDSLTRSSSHGQRPWQSFMETVKKFYGNSENVEPHPKHGSLDGKLLSK